MGEEKNVWRRAEAAESSATSIVRMNTANGLILAGKMFVVALVVAFSSKMLFGYGVTLEIALAAIGEAIGLWALAFVVACAANLVSGRKMPVKRYAAWWGCAIVIFGVVAAFGQG